MADNVLMNTSEQLRSIFEQLNGRIEELNQNRHVERGPIIAKADVKLLGQMSLLANQKVSLLLSLAQTADLDALLDMDSAVKKELNIILKKHGLIYDEDSPKVWQPEGTRFDLLFDLKNVHVTAMDPESVLVSKAVKAPEKNRQLIREAIYSAKFPTLIDRIESNHGNLEFFAKG